MLHIKMIELLSGTMLFHPGPTCSEEGSCGVVHGQSVDQLSGRGEHWTSFKQREGQGRVIRGDVQLQRGVDADHEVDRLDGESLKPHRVNQGMHRLKDLDSIRKKHICSCTQQGRVIL